MTRQRIAAVVFAVISLAVSVLAVLGGRAISAQDTGQAKYAVRVPNGLAFSEFRGYEGWQTVSVSRNDKLMAVILANPVMINAYQSGIPGNGKPFPDGSKMAKIHWNPKMNPAFQERARALVRTVWSRLEGYGFRAFKTVTVTVRFENFITFARSRTGREAWTSEEALWTAALDLLLPFLDARENPRNRKLRLIGVRAEKLSR
jgi:hypothetical protein